MFCSCSEMCLSRSIVHPSVHKVYRTVRSILCQSGNTAGKAGSCCIPSPVQQDRDPLAAQGPCWQHQGARMCQWGSNEDAKLCLVVPFPQGTWMTMDYPTGSVPSPTPPRTDLRGTLFTEKRTDGGSSSSLMAGSIQSFVLFCYVGGWVPSYFIWRNDTDEIM